MIAKLMAGNMIVEEVNIKPELLVCGIIRDGSLIYELLDVIEGIAYYGLIGGRIDDDICDDA